MNHIFRIIWSKALRAWVVASELVKSHGKGSSVDKRVAATEAMLERGFVEDPAPIQSWPLRRGIFMALLALCAPAQAADRWWDPNGTAIGLGGAGTWNTSNVFWSINNDGVSGPFSPWNNAALDDAFFAGTGGAVTLGGPITVHNITFQTNGYTITGGTLTLGGVDPTISVTTGAATISSLINGTSGLTKAGGGTLTLSNNNSFAGGLIVNAGALTLSGNNSFGSAPTVNSGTLTLTGTNSFVGDINVNGTLVASGAAALGDAGNNITISGGSLSIGTTGGSLTGRTVTLSGVARVGIAGAGIGGAHFTGTGGLTVSPGVNLTDDTNNYTGSTAFNGAGGSTFSSIGNLGEASSLGAPTTIANGTIGISNPSGTTGTRSVSYVGDGDVSNRNWVLTSNGYRSTGLTNSGTGTLTLTGAISVNRSSLADAPSFTAQTADLELLGVISGNDVVFNASAGRVLRLGDANTFASGSIGGAGKVEAATLANVGVASSLGTGGGTGISGTLSYVGAGASTNRNWSLSGTLSNDGTGMLTLSGGMGIGGTATLGGSFTGADNVVSGVISGAGNLRSGGAGTWVLTGTNTYTGNTVVDSGVLRAGSAGAFGASTTFVVNGGTLDMNDFDKTLTTLSGSGGAVDLGNATLTLQGATGVTASYAGNITGSGGLTKLGASTQTLTGANTYTGDTTIGGGVLNLDFSGAGGPASDIISSASTLNMSGGRLNVTGAAGENNSQTFDGVFISAGNNTINATSGAGGSLTVNLGAITRTGGLMNFNLPANGNITTSNTTLGGWATVNGTDYARVVGGNITAFTEADYTDKDNAANWLDNEFITDVTGFFGTVGSTVQLGGLRYTAPIDTTVTVAGGQTLGVDGTIIVAPSVGGFNQTITGGMITGTSGGGALGIQQNSTGNFTIGSQIVDNGGSIGFTKAGTGLVTLTNSTSNYTGGTTVAQGTLAVNNIGNGGVASSIGASSADSSNLYLEGATLRYTGGSTNSDRGFTFAKSGAILGDVVEVTNAAANLSFSGLVTSPDGANFTKTGAGTLTLANAGNDYTGITTVNGGMLSVNTLANGGLVSGIGASSNASANLVLAGGGLRYTGGTVSSDRGFTLGAGNGSIDVSDAASTLTLSGTAVGTGSLTKAGGGTLVLSGTNTYTGGNTVNGGILRAGSAQAFGAGPVNLANTAGVALDLNNFNNTIGALSGGGANGGNVTLGSATLRVVGGTGTYAGTISGTGGFTQASGTTTMVGCNNTYTGATTIGGAIVTDCLRDGGIASGIGASGSASTNLVFAGGTLSYTGGTIAIDRGFNTAAGGVFNITQAGTTLTIDGQWTGAGNLNKNGPGTLILTAANTATGSTVVNGGILRVASTTALGGVGGVSMANVAGALLDLDGFDTTVGFITGGGTTGGNIALDAANLTISNGFNGNYGGSISGSGSLIKNGTGVQTLSGCDNTYSGGTTINGGTLTVQCLNNGGTNSSIGASSAAATNLFINGTLRYIGTGNSSDRLFTLGTAGATLDADGTGALQMTNTGAVTLAGTNTARTLTLAGTNTGNNTLSAQIGNNGTGLTSLTKIDAGTWVLTNSNSTYTGVTRINGGVLSVSQMADGGLASSIGASSNAAANLVIGNGSTLRYTGAGDTTDRQFTLDTGVTFIESSGTGALQFTNTGAVSLTGTNTARTIALGGTNTGANTMGGAIGDNGTGATTLAKNDSGTWVLTGNNTFTGNTVINNGNLMIGNGGTTGNAGAGNVIVDSPTSTLSLNRSDTFTFGGTLSGPGTLAQIGTGTSVLTSADNQIGATTISAGTLDVNGGLTTPTVAMSGNSTLNVGGTVQAAGGTAALLTGDAGANTVNVSAGATLLANGDLGDGSDAISVAGILDTGAAGLGLGAGDDTLTLNDGAAINGAGIDAGIGAGDNLVVNNAAPLIFSGANVIGFEQLTKQNTGVLTTTGSHTFSAGTQIAGGTLEVDGDLTTPTISMGDNTALDVDGTLQAAGGTIAAITGSSGANTVSVSGSALASGDLGDGNDVLDVAGTLDTGGGIFDLGDGDDTLTIHEGTNIIGTVVAGAGMDTFDTHIDTSADLGAVQGFEALTKTGVGVLNITGPMTSDFVAVSVLDGTLNVQVGGSFIAAPGSTLNTTVANGAILQVDGSYTASAGADTFDVSGTVSGAGSIALGDGDDILTLNDGAVLDNAIDGGNGSDTVVLNNAGALSFDATNTSGYEFLTKQNSGIATLTGSQGYIGGTTIFSGTLDVDGALETPTIDLSDGAALNVDGTAQAAGSTQAIITGSAGANTVSVGVTGTLFAAGGLGDGNDVLDVAGILDTGAGVFDLGAGDDTFVIYDGTQVFGTVIAGAGVDTQVFDLAGTADIGAMQEFEGLTKRGIGTLNLTGPAVSELFNVHVEAGTLDVQAGANVTAQPGSALNTIVLAGATFNVDGGYTASAGTDTFDVSGTVSGAGSIALGDGDDILTLNDGAVLDNAIDGGNGSDTVVLNNAGALSFDATNTSGYEFLTKQNSGIATLTGSQGYIGGTTILSGTLDVDGTLETPTIGLSDGATLNVDGTAQAVGPTQAIVTGSAGANTVSVGATGTLFAVGGLGDGSDLIDVAGTLDTGGGIFDLGDGDDTLTIHEGTRIIGTVAAGAGTDTFNTHIDTNADLGAAQGFEALTKTGIGVLNITGPMTSDFVAVNVLDGTLNVQVGGSFIATPGSTLNTTVANGAILHVDGSYAASAGADTFDVSGTVSGAGSIALGDGDDILTLNDGADLSNLATPIDGGGHIAGDAVVLNFSGNYTLGDNQTASFEILTKRNAGTATLTGTQAWSQIDIEGGTLAANGLVTAPTVAMADGTALTVGGTLQAGSGTAATIGGSAGVNTITVAAGGNLFANVDLGDGNDRFASAGNVHGALAFGSGDDSVDFLGGDLSGIAGLDGGAGSGDSLSFHGMSLDNDVLTPATGWERVNLVNGSELSLSAPLDLSGSLLWIDPSSQLIASTGASLTGDLANSGLITVGSARFGVNGNYTGGGALALTVSPIAQTSGGLDITGDVVGNTAISFNGDGTQAPPQSASILVISSPNDDPATAGGFTAAGSVDGVVRLSGSVFPWSFGQQGDGWYLNAATNVVLPEIGGYAVLSSIGRAGILENNRLLSQRMSGLRADTPHCGANEEDPRAYWNLAGDCRGFWVAATASELRMGADPGFGFSGDSNGVYVGADVLLQDRETRTFRGGLYAGFQRGNYWTDGDSSTGLHSAGEANVRTDTPTFGMYGSIVWPGGTYADTTLVAQIPKATIAVAGGFKEEILGNSLTLSTQVGHRFHLDNGWTVEPQAQLSASAVHWQDKVDVSGKQLAVDDGLLGMARAAVRAEKTFETGNGARIRPWATLGLQDTIGENENALVVASPGLGEDAAAFPNHQLGLTATLDLGVEAELNESVSLFGVLSYDKSIDGTDAEQRQANLGVRIRW